MGKDPAILFYPEAFITGTIFMSDEEVGKYIKLLCYQHQHGGLIEKTSFDSMVNGHKILKSKFVETADGYFNERLMNEMEKRSVKSSNMSAVAKIRWDAVKEKECKSNAKAFHKDMQTKDKDRNKDKDQIPYEHILSSLNVRLGKHYKYDSKETKKLIRARWKEGYREKDFAKVHENMCNAWLKSEQAPFLRPITLYSNKFESYLNYIPKTIIKKESEYI